MQLRGSGRPRLAHGVLWFIELEWNDRNVGCLVILLFYASLRIVVGYLRYEGGFLRVQEET